MEFFSVLVSREEAVKLREGFSNKNVFDSL